MLSGHRRWPKPGDGIGQATGASPGGLPETFTTLVPIIAFPAD
jgi:hypothetical protein